MSVSRALLTIAAVSMALVAGACLPGTWPPPIGTTTTTSTTAAPTTFTITVVYNNGPAGGHIYHNNVDVHFCDPAAGSPCTYTDIPYPNDDHDYYVQIAGADASFTYSCTLGGQVQTATNTEEDPSYMGGCQYTDLHAGDHPTMTVNWS